MERNNSKSGRSIVDARKRRIAIIITAKSLSLPRKMFISRSVPKTLFNIVLKLLANPLAAINKPINPRNPAMFL